MAEIPPSPSPSPGPAGYAGDLTVEESWALLQKEPAAVLVDVRSTAEWTFVGVPDLSGAGKRAVLIEWQVFPGMTPNPAFVQSVKAALGAERPASAPVLFLCRSGARSRAAAMALTAAGHSRCYNIAGGFEGDLDGEGHRGRRNGWKAAGLPWAQS